MNRTIIYTRTAEGAREVAAPTQQLPRNLDVILKAIDGKSSVDALLCRLDHLSPNELDSALSILTKRNLICQADGEATAASDSMPNTAEREPSTLSNSETVLKAQQLRAKIRSKREVTDRAPDDESPSKDNQAEQAAREAAERVRAEIEADVRREIEGEARRKAEEEARRKAAESARQEAEERVRQEVTERVRQEVAQRIREEEADRIRREEADRIRREEADRIREEESERIRREEADRVREEEAHRIRQEEAAQVPAVDQAKSLAESAERERHEAEEQARQVAEENAVREAQESARREAEARARQVAEEKAWRETEERIRREEEEAATIRATEKKASRERKAGLGALAKWSKVITLGLVVLLLGGLAAVHLISFDGQIPQFEKSMAAQFQQPVKIAALRFAMLPQMHLRLEGISIGGDGQIKIPHANVAGGLGNLFGRSKSFNSIELEAPVVSEEALGWVLFGKPQEPDLLFGQIKVNGGTVASRHLALSPFDATIQTASDGAWKSMAIESQDKNIAVDLTSTGDTVQFEFKARTFKIPFGSTLALDEVAASGTASRGGLAIKEFKAFAFGGTLGGNGALTWGPNWRLSGEVNAKQVDTARLIPSVLDSARVAGSATYSMQAPEAAKLFLAPRLEGDFGVPRGTLKGVDLGRLFQAGDIRGETKFTDLAGTFVHERGATQLKQMRLSQGTMTASGGADVDADGNVRGRFAVDLKLSTEQRRANLLAAGTINKIEWRR